MRFAFILLLLSYSLGAQTDNYTYTKGVDKTIPLDQKYRLFSKSNYSYGLINANDEVIFPAIFDVPNLSKYSKKKPATNKDIQIIFQYGLQQGIYDIAQERWIVPLDIQTIEDQGNQVFKLSKIDKIKFINSDAETILTYGNTTVHRIKPQSSYYIVQDKTTKIKGVFDLKSQKLILPIKYSSIQLISDTGVFIVTEDNTSFNTVNTNNELITRDTIIEYQIVNSQSKHFYAKTKKGQGLLSKNGYWVIPPNYNKLQRLYRRFSSPNKKIIDIF